MRIRQHINTTNVQSGLNAASNQAQANAQARFDAALLQAAQAVRESDSESAGSLSPRMQTALEAALDQLNQKSLPQLQVLADQPQGLAALMAHLTQTGNLNPAESAQLNKLLLLALPRMLAHKSDEEVLGKTAKAISTGGAHPGPQGGTPIALAFPADFFGNGLVQTATTGVNAAAFQQSANPNGAFSQLVLGGADRLGAIQSPAASNPLQNGLGSSSQGTAGLGNTAIPVVVNSGAPLGAQAGLQSSMSVVQGSSRNQPLVNPGTSNSGNSGLGTTGAGAGVTAEQASNQNPAPLQAANPTLATEFPVLLDMNVQMVDNTVPLSIQAGTQVTLKGDGSWVFPQGATPAVKSSASVTPVAVAQVPSNQGEQALQANLLLDTANAATVVPGLTLAPSSAASTDPAQTGVPSLDSEFSQQLQDLVQQSFGLQAPSVSQTTIAQQATAEGQALGNSQAQAGQQLLAQVPNVGQVLPTNTAPGSLLQKSLDALTGQPTTNGAGLQDNTQASSLAQTSSFSGALAAAGQNNGQAFPGQPGLDGLVSKSVSQQISDAIDGVGGANPGRLVIRLNPADLGEVQVDLSMVDGKLTARLVTNQQDVRDALVRDLPGFKAALESHGVIVNEVSVAMRSNAGDLQQGSQGQDQQNQNWWRAVPQFAANKTAGVPAGVSAYAGSSVDTLQGFSALA